ncbi:MAG TPA: hypothetical protein VFS43_24090 [Polyangiaceae bacterium]|nr:hypothetical protein [Polyangiaceae bacterium]
MHCFGLALLSLPLGALACAGSGTDDEGASAGTAGQAAQGGTGGTGGAAFGAGGAASGGAAGASASGGTGGAGGNLTLLPSDVSTLFPPPASAAEWEMLLAPTASGPRGALLPPSVWQAMNVSLFEATPNEYEMLRLVSFRLDPCFRVDGGQVCEPQIRLIWQPSNEGDAAVHTLYKLRAVEFDRALAAVAGLRAGHTEAEPTALAAHPVLRAEGLGGAYASALRQFVLDYAGASTLTRLAIFAFPGSRPLDGVQQWSFLAFDVVDGASVSPRTVAPGSASKIQFFDTDAAHPRSTPDGPSGLLLASDPGACEATVSISTDGAPDLFGPSASVCALSPVEAEARVHSALRFENPLLTPSDSTACANCHLAPTLRLLAESRFGVASASFVERYGAEPDHTASALRYFGATRAFGYVKTPAGLDVSVSPRVVHETSEVLKGVAQKVGRAGER